MQACYEIMVAGRHGTLRGVGFTDNPRAESKPSTRRKFRDVDTGVVYRYSKLPTRKH